MTSIRLSSIAFSISSRRAADLMRYKPVSQDLADRTRRNFDVTETASWNLPALM